MVFHIEHTTEYTYPEAATESFSELRLRPRESNRQLLSQHCTYIQPQVPVESYVDYFGNYVETISIPFRHTNLLVRSISDVETTELTDALSGIDLTISEAQQLYHPFRRELFDYLQPSHFISWTPEIVEMARALLPGPAPFAESLYELNNYIFENFRYESGVTNAQTTVAEFFEQHRGVCQDFAHLMISVCRCAGIPARYVSGYIESDIIPANADGTVDPALIGNAASHAWVEIFSPNFHWVGMDPTNNILEGERHVQVGIGRDYYDVPPLAGVFKGRKHQTLNVQVRVMRTQVTPE
jgi:transglutaminase-like putative cysteine protease